jgi:hypothetical protein
MGLLRGGSPGSGHTLHTVTGVWVDEIDERQSFAECIYFEECDPDAVADPYAHAVYCPFVGVEYAPAWGEYGSNWRRRSFGLQEIVDWPAEPPVPLDRLRLNVIRAFTDADDDGLAEPECVWYPVCACGDMDFSGGLVDLGDFATFAACFGLSGPNPSCTFSAFICSDMDANGAIDLADFATFATWYGLTPTEIVPFCEQ